MIQRDLKKLLAAALSVAMSIPAGILPAAAQTAETAAFQGVEVGEDSVTIKLSREVLYNSFLTQTPPRLVMELQDVKHDSPSRSVKGKGQFLAGVRTSQFEKTPRLITRVVMDLVKMAGYKVSAAPGGLTVQLVGSVEEPEPASAAAPAPEPVVAKRAVKAKAVPAPAPAPVEAAAAPAPPVPAMSVVPTAEIQAAAPAGKVALTAESTGMSPMDFMTATTDEKQKAADALAAARATRPKVRPPYNALQAMKSVGLDSTMTTELAAVAQNSDISQTKFSGSAELYESDSSRKIGGQLYRDIVSRLPRDPVDLDFENTDIQDVIRLLAAKAKVNIIFGSDVSGTLTLRLTRVPFNEAFRTVLSMMNLTTDQVGDNILRVITPAELTKQRTSSTAITKVFQLNYSKASEVKTTVDAVRQAEGRSGSTTADTKTNTLIVTDSLEGLIATENLIGQLDVRPRQVLIEAKLVEVNANSGLNYGVQWDYFGIDKGRIGGQQGNTVIGGPVRHASDTPTKPFDGNQAVGLDADNGGLGAFGRGTGVALAADRVFGALTLGRITNNFILNATLSAAASQGKAKVLSEPKIATLNNQAADINVTTQIPYVTSNVASTGVQTQTVTYVTTGIQLKVTPSINADGRITLMINPNVSQPSVAAAGSTQTGAPAIDARAANTTVLVRDGETIVIGGLINDTMQDTVAKIPLLGDIPILGWLFKKKTKTRVRNELLIFVTTRILPD